MAGSTYRGLYVQRLRNGRIYNVQVEMADSPRGITFSPEDYQARGIEPPLKELPNEAEYFAGQAQQKKA
jgi:hypothetical protein